MMNLRKILLVPMLIAMLVQSSLLRAEGLKFEDVFNAVRTNLAGVTEKELNETAIEGFLTQLQPRVLLVTNELLADAAAKGPTLIKTAIYDGNVAYLRVARVAAGLAAEIIKASTELQATNKIKGMVLDLRFAAGTDYAEAGAVADVFLSKENLLLDWGTGTARSKAKSNALTFPLSVLINRKTTGAAEALAAVLRQNEVGLTIGATTAGQAEIFKEIKLDNGLRLMIAIAPVKLSDGQPVSKQGQTPDIAVNVAAEEEAAYWQDPLGTVNTRNTRAATAGNSSLFGATNLAPGRRINEADLVRLQKEGSDGETATSPRRPAESAKPLVRDPVLARALDLLKGLAVVQKSRPATP